MIPQFVVRTIKVRFAAKVCVNPHARLNLMELILSPAAPPTNHALHSMLDGHYAAMESVRLQIRLVIRLQEQVVQVAKVVVRVIKLEHHERVL